METCIIKSPLGFIKITGDIKGVTSITFLNSKTKKPTTIPSILQNCATQLDEYFCGIRKTFTVKLNPEGTHFQKNIWENLEEIPFGNTMSYLELSKKIKNQKAVRAVANANGKNPILIIIPCHRIIGENGHLTGYSAGLHHKKWLLEHESPSPQKTLFNF